MRHRKIRSKLNRTSEHRLALMRSLSAALVRNSRIRTTHVKARALRSFLEPLITRAKVDDLHSRRLVFSRLGKKDVVHKLFVEIGPVVADRPGGYLRVVKDARRAGDGALMAFIEFVDDVAPEGNEGRASLADSLKKRQHERRKEMRKART